MSETKKLLALLIDGDNVSPILIPQILEKLTTYGNPTVRRVYGNESSIRAWTKAAVIYSLECMLVTNNTKGKNAVDISLVINAMELLYVRSDLTDFCIVSSDGDFTGLANFIKEKGKFVLGMGKRQTPKSFVNACSKFVYIKEPAKAKASSLPTPVTQAATPAPKAPAPKAAIPKPSTPKAPAPKVPTPPKPAIPKAPAKTPAPKPPAPAPKAPTPKTATSKPAAPSASTPPKPPVPKAPASQAPTPKTATSKPAAPSAPTPPKPPVPKAPASKAPELPKPAIPKAPTLPKPAIPETPAPKILILPTSIFETSFIRAYEKSLKNKDGWAELREISENMNLEFQPYDDQTSRLFVEKAKSLAAIYPSIVDIMEHSDDKSVVYYARIDLAARFEFDVFLKAYKYSADIPMLKDGWVIIDVIGDMLRQLYKDHNPLIYRGTKYKHLLEVVQEIKKDYPDVIEIGTSSTGHPHIRIKG